MPCSESKELRLKLIDTWLAIVEQNRDLPGALCFYTDGVRLVCNDSPVLDRLRALDLAGVEALQQDTCVQADRFFSYRRATKNREPDYGRGLSAIALAG